MRRIRWTLLITATSVMLSVPGFAAVTSTTTHHHRHHHKRAMSVVSRINLNTASRSELEQLPGVNAEAAHRIIAGRPWNDAHDLVSKGIISEDAYKDLHLKVSTANSRHTAYSH